MSEIVFKVSNHDANQQVVRRLQARAKKNPGSLNLLIVDECHAWLGPAFDSFVNSSLRFVLRAFVPFGEMRPFGLRHSSVWDFVGGTAPTLTTTASAVDRIDYVVFSTSRIQAVATLAYS